MDDGDVSAARSEGATPSRAPALSTWLLTAVMALLALGVAAPGWIAEPGLAVPGPRWLALLPLFALAEVVVIYLPTQRNAHGHTLREIPAVLGLTFLAPQQYVTAYVAGAVLALVVSAHMRGVKLVFNAAMFALEASLGALTYHAILQDSNPLSAQGWLAVLIAVLVTDLLSAAAVTAAISLTEGAFDGEVLHEAMRSGSVAAFINTCVALLVATLLLVQPTALPLLGVVVVLLFLGYRDYISLARGHTQTQALYRFVGHTSSANSLEEVSTAVLAHAGALMHAEHAWLVEFTDDEVVQQYTLSDGALCITPLPRPGPDAWWWSTLTDGAARFVPMRPSRHGDSGAARQEDLLSTPRDGLAVLLRGSGHTRCVLVVCNRSFDKETFSTEDAEVLEALAAHAAVALERARGVTELQTLADELVTARDAALAASEAKSLFLANMSHEIRTPLTTVLATAEMLEDMDLGDQEFMLVEKMRRQGALLKSLVEQILDFSRIEAGEVALRLDPFDLHAMTADVADVYVQRATEQGVAFTCEVDPLVPRIVMGDAGRMFQVLTNLLDNAMKFTHEGSVSLQVSRHTGAPSSTGSETSGIRFVVRDTGIGIPPEAQASIFEVFNQVDGTATRRYEGTGLGLAICRQLLELMGGSVTVASSPGVGSAFTVLAPLAAAPSAPAPVVKTSRGAPALA